METLKGSKHLVISQVPYQEVGVSMERAVLLSIEVQFMLHYTLWRSFKALVVHRVMDRDHFVLSRGPPAEVVTYSPFIFSALSLLAVMFLV